MADNERCSFRPLTLALWAAAVLGVALPLGIAAWTRVSKDMGQCRQASEWKARGDSAFAAGDHSIAVRAYGRARSLAPDRRDVAAAMARARVHELAWFPEGLRGIDLDEVRLEIAQVEAAFPGDRATATALRGFVASATGRIPEGEKLYQQALELDKGNGPAHLGQALLLRRQDGKQKEAVAEMKEALKARPKSPELNAMLGRMQADMGDFAGALESLKAATDARQDASTLRDLGQAYLATQDMQGALKALQDSVRLDARDPVTLSLLAQAYLIAQKPDLAENAARASLSIQDDSTTAFRLASALNGQRKFGEAVPLLQRLASGSNDLLVYQELGNALAGVGRLKEAAQVFGSVVAAPLPKDETQARIFKSIQDQANQSLQAIQQALGGARK